MSQLWLFTPFFFRWDQIKSSCLCRADSVIYWCSGVSSLWGQTQRSHRHAMKTVRSVDQLRWETTVTVVKLVSSSMNTLFKGVNHRVTRRDTIHNIDMVRDRLLIMRCYDVFVSEEEKQPQEEKKAGLWWKYVEKVNIYYSGQQAANLAVLFVAASADLDSRLYIGGLFWSTNLTPLREHLFPPQLRCKSEPSMCRPLREMGGGVGDLHCCATHSRGVLKPGNSWSQQSVHHFIHGH